MSNKKKLIEETSELQSGSGAKNHDRSQSFIDVGHKLQAARVGKNIEMKKMSLALKIKIDYIQLIEKGLYVETNKKTYYYGCVVAMAKYLELDWKTILDRVISYEFIINQAEKSADKISDYGLASDLHKLDRQNKPKTNGRKIFIVVLMLIGLLTAYVLRNRGSSTSREDEAIVNNALIAE